MENNNSSDFKSNEVEKKPSLIKEIMQWIEAILLAIVIALLIRGFVFEPVKVQGPSMENTLFSNERLIIYKLGYYFSSPKKGDIIVLEVQKGLFRYLPIPDPREIDYIKRVIAVPGDVIDIKDGYVYVNGNKLEEPYAKGMTVKRSMTFPKQVPPDSVFVLGDNRENSSDSRQLGFIDYNKIRGKAVFRIWPANTIGGLYK